MALDFDAEAAAADATAGEDDGQDDRARSEAGSVGSLAAATALDAAGGSPPPLQPYEQAWPGGPHIFDDYLMLPADFTDDAERSGRGGAVRDTRQGVWHGRDSIGLFENGRYMYCDCCVYHHSTVFQRDWTTHSVSVVMMP